METELKLLVAPDDIARLVRAPELQAAPTQNQRLINRYFDTPDEMLSANGVALRLRYQDGQWLQTLKGPSGATGGLHQRSEWEMPVRGPALEWDRLPQEALPVGLDQTVVEPRFETNFDRTAWWVDLGGNRIEVALDQGAVESGGARAPICELELELVQGKPSALFQLAGRLCEQVTLFPGAINKAERGFRLLNSRYDYPPAPQQGKPLWDWVDTLARQAEALPDSAATMAATLFGIADAGDLDSALVESIADSLETPPDAWYKVADIDRVGRWLIHLSRQSVDESGGED